MGDFYRVKVSTSIHHSYEQLNFASRISTYREIFVLVWFQAKLLITTGASKMNEPYKKVFEWEGE